MGFLGNAFGWIRDKFTGAKDNVKDTLSTARQSVSETRQKVTGVLRKVFIDTPVGLVQDVLDAGKTVVGKTRDAIGWTLKGALGLATSAIKTPFVVAGAAIDVASRPFRGGRDLIKQTPDMISNLWHGDPNGVRTIIRDTRTNLLQNPVFA